MSRNPKEIESEIALARSRIEDRLNKLGSELSPAQILSQAVGIDRAGPTEAFEVIKDRARRSPISAALVGAGLLGLFMAGRRESYPSNEPRIKNPLNPASSSDPAERIGDNIAHLKASSTSTVAAAKQTAHDAKERARLQATLGTAELWDTAATVGQSISHGIDTVSEKVDAISNQAGQALKETQHFAARAGDRTTDAVRAAPVRIKAQGEAAIDWVRENPVPAGLMAVAAGAALSSVFAMRGSNAPSSRYQASQRLHKQAQANDGDAKVFLGHPDDNLRPAEHVDPKPEKSVGRRTTKTKRAKKGPAKTRANKPVAKASEVKPKNVKRSTAVLGTATDTANS